MPQMLSVHLDRASRTVPWGIQLGGGCDAKIPLCITEVDGEALATHQLCPGDEVLFVQGVDAMHLLESEAQEVFRRAGRTLELLVAKPDRPNTPVRVPEPIRLTATPEPEDTHDDEDDDARNRGRQDDDEDDELMRRRVVDTYYRMRQDADDGRRQQRVVREDSWWIQGDREDDGNVRPTDKQRALAGWPLRRNSEGSGGRRERSADRATTPISSTLPRRTKSLRGRPSPERKDSSSPKKTFLSAKNFSH
ncbi:uncharacterized protein LOC117647333 [Thrips palmi]|uniref:Uncharacterized protein LOC117647333 n=1 Tax=Thrips palmi TaxID=161013 RepID=A0A6P8ZPZ1_THRPL|nr:uncharacterized protein LOC117647333 [Thrips palmi]